MNKLLSENKEQSISCESAAPDYEKKFCRLLAADIAADLQTSYASRDIVVNLLTTCLERRLCKRDGMLEGYLHSQLDTLAKTLKHEFSIGDHNVNYQYATHAKFSDIVSAIKAKHKEELDAANKPKPDYYPGSI